MLGSSENKCFLLNELFKTGWCDFCDNLIKISATKCLLIFLTPLFELILSDIDYSTKILFPNQKNTSSKVVLSLQVG